MFECCMSECCSNAAFGGRERVSEVTFDKLNCKNLKMYTNVHKMAKVAMSVIAFKDLKRLAETSSTGYCASYPLPEKLECRRYKCGFQIPLFSCHSVIDRAPLFSLQNERLLADQTINCAVG